MLEKSIQYMGGLLAVFAVLCFERVVGVPLLSVIFFYTFFLSQGITGKGVTLTVFSLIVASVFMISPLVVSIVLLIGYAFFMFTTTQSGRMSLRVVYVSLGVALIYSSVAHIVWSLQVLLFLFLQIAVGLVVTRKYMFKETAKNLQWQRTIYTGEVYEKKI